MTPKQELRDKMSKFNQLLEIEGLEFDGYLEQYAHESVVPGICTNENCDYTTNVEPDCFKGYCENCKTQTVQSGHALLGVI